MLKNVYRRAAKWFDFPTVLFAVFAVTWVWLAIDPLYRFGWFIENIVVFLAVPLALFSYWKFRLSNTTYAIIFIFGILHIAAAHYTYGATPWGDWVSAVLDLERNHYDRVVHFLYGVLAIPVFADILRRYLPSKALVGGIFLVSLVVAIGSVYEIAEFVAGVTLNPDAGLAFLGFQGDVWDTQKDMALQTIGALLGLAIFLPLWRKKSGNGA